MLTVIKLKKLKIGQRLHNLPEMLDAKITVASDGKLHFPVLLVYEEAEQCDLIKVP